VSRDHVCLMSLSSSSTNSERHIFELTTKQGRICFKEKETRKGQLSNFQPYPLDGSNYAFRTIWIVSSSLSKDLEDVEGVYTGCLAHTLSYLRMDYDMKYWALRAVVHLSPIYTFGFECSE
jgi:hypothetical protein